MQFQKDKKIFTLLAKYDQYIGNDHFNWLEFFVVVENEWDEWDWEYYVDEKVLIVKRISKLDGSINFLRPLCSDENIKYALELLKDYADANGQDKIHFCFATEHFVNVFKSLGTADYELDFLWKDYIYETEDLKTLAGKRYQKKRNNLNSFVKNYGAVTRIEELSATHAYKLTEFLNNYWTTKKNYLLTSDMPEKEKVIEGLGRSVTFDMHILKHWDHFHKWFKGIVVLINDEVKGFSYFSTLKRADYTEIFGEKADYTIRGLYQFLMCNTLNHFNVKTKYVNRQDAGFNTNLEASKLSYLPVLELSRYCLIWKRKI